MGTTGQRKAAHVHYSGNVQGVGFRWTTRTLAGGHDVAGYVRNLPDGRVELFAEGPQREVKALLDDVQAEMGRHIRDASVQWGPPTGTTEGFSIRR